jgi:hypothetical protein
MLRRLLAGDTDSKVDELHGRLVSFDAIKAIRSRRIAALREALLQLPQRLNQRMASVSDPAKCHDSLRDELHGVLASISAPICNREAWRRLFNGEDFAAVLSDADRRHAARRAAFEQEFRRLRAGIDPRATILQLCGVSRSRRTYFSGTGCSISVRHCSTTSRIHGSWSWCLARKSRRTVST